MYGKGGGINNFKINDDWVEIPLLFARVSFYFSAETSRKIKKSKTERILKGFAYIAYKEEFPLNSRQGRQTTRKISPSWQRHAITTTTQPQATATTTTLLPLPLPLSLVSFSFGYVSLGSSKLYMLELFFVEVLTLAWRFTTPCNRNTETIVSVYLLFFLF